MGNWREVTYLRDGQICRRRVAKNGHRYITQVLRISCSMAGVSPYFVVRRHGGYSVYSSRGGGVITHFPDYDAACMWLLLKGDSDAMQGNR